MLRILKFFFNYLRSQKVWTVWFSIWASFALDYGPNFVWLITAAIKLHVFAREVYARRGSDLINLITFWHLLVLSFRVVTGIGQKQLTQFINLRIKIDQSRINHEFLIFFISFRCRLDVILNLIHILYNNFLHFGTQSVWKLFIHTFFLGSSLSSLFCFVSWHYYSFL